MNYLFIYNYFMFYVKYNNNNILIYLAMFNIIL